MIEIYTCSTFIFVDPLGEMSRIRIWADVDLEVARDCPRKKVIDCGRNLTASNLFLLYQLRIGGLSILFQHCYIVQPIFWNHQLGPHLQRHPAQVEAFDGPSQRVPWQRLAAWWLPLGSPCSPSQSSNYGIKLVWRKM